MEEWRKVYTIGHSNHKIEYFFELLQSHTINCLIDVRSTPISSYNPQFNSEPLKNYLKKRGVYYMHFGKEFGARQEDLNLLDENGIVNFKRFQKTSRFKEGVERVKNGVSKGFKIALMCSEGNPLECHRFSMISVYLEFNKIKVAHILKDKKLVSHEELELQLIRKYSKKLAQTSLFEPSIDKKRQLDLVYELHNKEVGWQPEQHININSGL